MSYTLISTQTLNSNVTTVTFSSIPQTYTDLVLVTSARSTLAASVGSSTYMSLNGSSANFAHRRFYGNGSAAYANVDGVSSAYSNDINGQGTNTYNFSNSKLTFYNYTSANYKPYTIDTAVENSNSTAAYTMLTSGIWSNTAAITSISFASEGSSSFQSGSTFSLYGVNRIPTATLGATPTVEYLVVAGGGGAGGGYGGGGGAGGYRSSVAGNLSGGGASAEALFSPTAGTSYTVTVGAGGAGQSNLHGATGSSSVFASITSTGGGGGGGGGNGDPSQNTAYSGGSGGGGSGENIGSGAAGTSSQGFAGANGTNSTSYAGGGGGGASGAGGAGLSTGGGIGGAGITSSVTGSVIARAGGGGGAVKAGYSVGSGGVGGGGNGGVNATGSNGQIGTGGGAGGTTGFSNGGNGGSGVVIIRYPDTYANPTATTGNPVVNYANGYKIYTWTASGSITF